MSEPIHNHDELFEFDCCHPCPQCKERGPHSFGDEPYCDLCGSPHEGYFSAVKRMAGGVE